MKTYIWSRHPRKQITKRKHSWKTNYKLFKKLVISFSTMFTFGYLFSRMSWSNICFHRYFSQYLSLYEVFNVHSLRKAKPLEVSSKLLYQSTFISNAFGSGQLHSFMFLTEWRWRDSNSWPPACKAGALPTELHPHLEYSKFSFFNLAATCFPIPSPV